MWWGEGKDNGRHSGLYPHETAKEREEREMEEREREMEERER